MNGSSSAWMAFCILGLFAAPSKTGPPPDARSTLTHLRQQADAARKSGDTRARLKAILAIKELLNDAPDIVEVTAAAYAELGDTHNALAALKLFADFGQTDNRLLSGSDKRFVSIEHLPEYNSILRQFARNKTPTSHAENAFAVPDPGMIAEDLAYDSQTRSFLISAVLGQKIIRIGLDGKASDFAVSPSHWPMLALAIDSKRNRLWATEVALDGFTSVPKADWGRSAILCFDLQTSALLRRLEAPAHSALGDMTLTGAGDPIVSDGVGGGIYKVSDDRLELIDSTNFISPQTPALLPSGTRVLIPDYARGIAILDLTSKQVEWLNPLGKTKVALGGIDGLYFNRGNLYMIQNGTSPERVIRLRLNKALKQITSQQIIERATPTLGDPTHGVVVADSFYYIANSGWDQLDDQGNLKKGGTFTPARIKRFFTKR